MISLTLSLTSAQKLHSVPRMISGHVESLPSGSEVHELSDMDAQRKRREEEERRKQEYEEKRRSEEEHRRKQNDDDELEIVVKEPD